MNTPHDHRSFRIEAKTTMFESETSLDEYIKKHHAIRSKTIAANYPRIHNESTTVKFLIDGLRHNHSTVDVGRTPIGMNPQSIKDFVNMYNHIATYNTVPKALSTSPYPTPTFQPCAGPYMPRRCTVRNPCSFHLQFMRRYSPTYTDAECTDPHHPKFHK